MTTDRIFEVIIIGGSYAGLSAAMSLGRSLRKVLIIDSGSPCNTQTPYSHNFLTQDGKSPKEISMLARKQVEQYKTIQFYNGVATTGVKSEDGFLITTDSKEIFQGKKLIFATGLKDLTSSIKGLSACWGISVLPCPYCHGYEFRYQNTGIIASGDNTFHLATLVYNLTRKVTILTNGKSNFSAEQAQQLHKNAVNIVESAIAEIEHENGYLKGVLFEDGSKLGFDAIYAGVPFMQNSDIPETLGCETTELGYIKVDAMQQTTIQDVYACGDNSVMMRSLAGAVYTGNLTGAVVNGALAGEAF